MSEQNKQDPAEGAKWAYLFAQKEADPEFYRRQAAQERDEIHREVMGNALLESHTAYLRHKQQQQQSRADWFAGQRARRDA